MIIEGEVQIKRTPREVFDFLADTGRWAAVDEALIETSARGSVNLGTTGSLTHRRPGVKITTTFEVTAFEPGERFEVLIRGRGYELCETVELAAENGGTRLSVTDLLEPTSLLGRGLVAISGGTVRRDLEARRTNLKRLLEHDAG